MGVTFAKKVAAHNPVLWYRFGEATGPMVYDQSVSANHGVINNIAGSIIVPGQPGGVPHDPNGSYLFSSHTSWSELGPWIQTSRDIPNLTACTVGILLKPDTTSDGVAFTNNGTGPDGKPFAMLANANTGVLALTPYFGTYSFSPAGMPAVDGNTWLFVCWTFDPTQALGAGIQFFVDGVGYGRGSRRDQSGTVGGTLTIGLNGPGANRAYGGGMDEFFILDYPIAPSQIADLYRAALAPNPLYYIRQREMAGAA